MFCKNCGTQMQDGAAFCPNCGTKIEAPAGQTAGQPTGGVYPNGAQGQPGGYPNAPYQGDPRMRQQSSLDVMGICALSAGALGAILGLVALIKGVQSMTMAGLLSNLYSSFTGGAAASGNIVLAIVAAALGVAGIVLAKKSVASHGDNSFAKFGKILGIVSIILGAAGLVFSIIGMIRQRNAPNYMDELGNLFEDWF